METGDHSHGRSTSISCLDSKSLLMESKDCWEEAGNEVMEGGLWEDRVEYSPLGQIRVLHRRAGMASFLWGFQGTVNTLGFLWQSSRRNQYHLAGRNSPLHLKGFIRKCLCAPGS